MELPSTANRFLPRLHPEQRAGLSGRRALRSWDHEIRSDLRGGRVPARDDNICRSRSGGADERFAGPAGAAYAVQGKGRQAEAEEGRLAEAAREARLEGPDRLQVQCQL